MSQPSNPSPPVALRIAHQTSVHGAARVDDYHWLRDKDDAAVLAHLRAENAYTEAVMGPTAAFQLHLYDEMLARIKETDMGVPARKGVYEYYARTEAGQSYPIHCRRKLQADSPEEILLDLNRLAEGHDYLALGAFSVSRDAMLLAYSTDLTGFREYTLRIKDLVSGEDLAEHIEKVRSIAWANDSRTLFYVLEDEAKRAYRLYRHALGELHDELLYEERDARFSIGVQRSRSEAYVFVTAHSATASEVYFLTANDPRQPLTLIRPREAELEYYADHHGDSFYIVSNDQGRNFRLVSAPLSDPSKQNWRELIAHREDVMLEGIDLFARHYVVHEREGGFPKLRVVDIETGLSRPIDMPEPVYAADSGANLEFDTDSFRFEYESLVTPHAVFDYDVRSGARRLLKQEEVLGGYDPAAYRSQLLYAQAADGALIPISLVYRDDRRGSAPAPLLLTGYGAYGYAHDVHFSSTRLSLLDRGVIVATAHVRGGGEMGKRWHDEGRMLSKRNTFTDFIAAAEHLIAHAYTDPGKLVIEGGSAGGLLMGAVTNMRPDLFRAVVAEVPFVDVVNTMLDSTLPLTTGEYEEWGNPQDPVYFEYLKSYSPYDNIERKAYPAMLVETSLQDSQVMYWEPAKFVAKLRACKTDRNPLLLKINMDAGHGGASGRYDYLREIAFTYAFILWQLDLAR